MQLDTFEKFQYRVQVPAKAGIIGYMLVEHWIMCLEIRRIQSVFSKGASTRRGSSALQNLRARCFNEVLLRHSPEP